MEALQQLDGSILLWIQQYLRQPFWNEFFTAFTCLGNHGMIQILFSVLLLMPQRTRKVGMICLLGLLGSLILNNLILKNAVARIRPYEVVPGLQLLIAKQQDFSFPSGHTAVSFIIAEVVLRYISGCPGIFTMIFAVLMAFSRLYVGVHYPTDVLAGAILGLLIGYWAGRLYEYLERTFKKKNNKNE